MPSLCRDTGGYQSCCARCLLSSLVFTEALHMYASQAGGADDLLGPSFPVGIVGTANGGVDEEDAAVDALTDVPSHYTVAVASR